MENIKRLLGQRIKELRNKKGITQQKFAELINIDQRNLSNIECGNTFPTKTLALIAQNLNVTLSELFNFNYLSLNVDEMKKYIAQHLDYLNEDNIKTLYRLVEFMR